MNGWAGRRWRAGRAVSRARDQGFTLVELLIGIVLSGMIAGVTVAALLTSTNIARSTSDAVNDSNDAGLLAAFLYRDAQSAGVTDPSTAAIDPTVGVSTANTVAGWQGCGQAAPLVVRFSWLDRTQSSAGTRVVVTYALDSTTGQLTRRTCIGATATLVPVGSHVTSATATCQPVADCTGTPSAVSLAVTGSALGHPITYTLTSSLRRLDQQAPSSTNSSPVPLVVLGDGVVSKPCPNLTISGAGVVHVIGDAIVDGSCHPPGTPISGTAALLQPTGTLTTFSPVADPFAGLVPPAYTCGSGVNPPVGQSSGPAAVVVYPQAVTVSTTTTFQPGRYVFCSGLAITGGTISGTGVQLFVAGGAMSIAAAATVDLTPITAGVSSEPLIWIAASASTSASIAAGAHVDNLRGIVYAPRATLQLSSALGLDLGGVIAREVFTAGPGQMRIGMPVPNLTVVPSNLPAGEVGVGYAATLTASGATAPLTWTATGLPSGITIDPTSGLVSGTPAAAGTYTVTATAIDGSGAGVS
ncbi:MAG TPA: putative Ig domain-containing protein, partial [Ilumatobacteraceae bacterium]